MWLSHTGYEEVVHSAWGSFGETGLERDIMAKVEKCGKDLTWWNRNVFGNVRMELGRVRKMLSKAENEAILSNNNFRVRQLQKEIDVLLEREATMWSQRSRILWAR